MPQQRQPSLHATSFSGGGNRCAVFTSDRPMGMAVPASELAHVMHPGRIYTTSQHHVIGYGYSRAPGRAPPVLSSVVVGRIPAGAPDEDHYQPVDEAVAGSAAAAQPAAHAEGDDASRMLKKGPLVSSSGNPQQLEASPEQPPVAAAEQEPASSSGTKQQPAAAAEQEPASSSSAKPLPAAATQNPAPPPQLDADQGAPAGPDVTPIKAAAQQRFEGGAQLGQMPTAHVADAPECSFTQPDVLPPPSLTSHVIRAAGHPPSDPSNRPAAHHLSNLNTDQPLLCAHRFSRPGDRYCAECGDQLEWFCAGSRGAVQTAVTSSFVGASVTQRRASLYGNSHPLVSDAAAHDAEAQRQHETYRALAAEDHRLLGGFGPPPPPSFRSVYGGHAPILSPSRFTTQCSSSCTCRPGSSISSMYH